ncbi:MAG TPA: type II secretion system major pseudopilin GspG [Bryobacteraceae bacterium]|nr:type II secretion system major pseudopilin GspG [Bryobacteraceae bacterium]
MRKRRRNRQSGVTLIEMLVVVTIIALFAAYVGMRLWPQADKARVTAAQAQIGSFMTALNTYKMDVGVFPTTEQGLTALRTRPANMPQWGGPYLAKDLPTDPWGRSYVYRYPGENSEDPEIISYGADGQPGGEGINADVVSWR